MNQRPKIHVFGKLHPRVLQRLARDADILTDEDPFPSDCDAIIVRARDISASDIAGCPHLKIIGKHGAGLDNIDLEAAKAAGIAVARSPGGNADSVADLAVGFALSLIRNIHPLTTALKKGEPIPAGNWIGWELGELPAGIAGMGAIGSAVAKRLANGFGSKVTAYDPGIDSEKWPTLATRAKSLEEIFETSRVVFLHIPLTEETRASIGAKLIRSMPHGSYLINCARGGIVDEAALAGALAAGHLAGAASDVFADEPPTPGNPLLQFPSFLATPHLGASTHAGLERTGMDIAEKILRHLAGASGNTQDSA